MRPRRTVRSNKVFHLVGGTEDNDLWCEQFVSDAGEPLIQSVWVPTDEERAEIVNGSNIVLTVWGSGTPPVALGVTDEQLGKAP